MGRLLRRLKPDRALDILQQVSAGRIADVNAFVTLRAKALLGESDSEDERERHANSVAAQVQAQACATEAEQSEASDDSDLFEKDGPPWLPLPESLDAEASEEQLEVLAKAKQEAIAAVEAGDVDLAVKKYTEAILTGGGATALMLARRAELLLKQMKPCAAIRDCADALEFNPD